MRQIWLLKGRVRYGALLSIWMVLFPPYVHSYNLAQANFLACPHWENPSGLSMKWEIFGWNVCSLIYDLDNSFFEFLRGLSSPKFGVAGQIIILRR